MAVIFKSFANNSQTFLQCFPDICCWSTTQGKPYLDLTDKLFHNKCSKKHMFHPNRTGHIKQVTLSLSHIQQIWSRWIWKCIDQIVIHVNLRKLEFEILKRVENIVAKGEIEQFLFLSQGFKNRLLQRRQKASVYGKGYTQFVYTLSTKQHIVKACTKI